MLKGLFWVIFLFPSCIWRLTASMAICHHWRLFPSVSLSIQWFQYMRVILIMHASPRFESRPFSDLGPDLCPAKTCAVHKNTPVQWKLQLRRHLKSQETFELYRQWRSQEGARGAIAPKLPSCPQFHLKKFLNSFAINVSRMSQFVTIGGTNQKKFLFVSLAALFCTPFSYSSGAVNDCNVSWIRWLVTIAP